MTSTLFADYKKQQQEVEQPESGGIFSDYARTATVVTEPEPVQRRSAPQIAAATPYSFPRTKPPSDIIKRFGKQIANAFARLDPSLTSWRTLSRITFNF